MIYIQTGNKKDGHIDRPSFSLLFIPLDFDDLDDLDIVVNLHVSKKEKWRHIGTI